MTLLLLVIKQWASGPPHAPEQQYQDVLHGHEEDEQPQHRGKSSPTLEAVEQRLDWEEFSRYSTDNLDTGNRIIYCRFMNFVFIMTDTQNKSMVGAYGNPRVNTPNLDRLASQGIRFERAYTTCPLCTPARGGIFSGLHPQVNGAYCNNVAPHSQVVLAGTIFRENGYRAAYTGKWHLDGSAYFGDGLKVYSSEPI